MEVNIDYMKLTAIGFVGVGAFYLIYTSDKQAGATLLGALLGYVFGNAHGFVTKK
jgi:hypothetical protein